MPDPFHGCIPDDRRYDTAYDMWVSPPDVRGMVRVGATAFGVHLAGEIIMFTGKPRGCDVVRGRGIGTVETGKTILAVHSPTTLANVRCNEAAEEQPQLIQRQPYGAGWLAEGLATDWAGDSARLVDAATYRWHVLATDPDALIEEDT